MAPHPLRDVLETLGREPAAVLDRLLRHERPVPAGDVVGGHGAAALERLIAAGIVRVDSGVAVPRVRVDPVGRLRIAADLRHHRRRRDFVVGPGPASFLLATSVATRGGGRALDLGCGSGIQALLLASAGLTVVGLDISPRALEFGRFNARVNGLERIELLEADFLGESADGLPEGRFDVVVANPPFVLAPERDVVYRDRSLPRDGVTRRTIERVATALAPGARGYILGSWIDVPGSSWSDPIREWTHELGVDVHVTRVASEDAAEYATVWTRDLEPDERGTAADRWAIALRAEGSARIHTGIVALGRPIRRRLERDRIEAIDRDPRAVDARVVEAFLAA